MSRMTRLQNSAVKSLWLQPVLLLSYGMLVAVLFVLRYDTLLSETDTSSMTLMIEAMRDEGTLLPEDRLYPHGFAYQVVSAFILNLTGLSVQSLQAVVWPLLAAGALAAVAFVFYLQTTGQRATAALSALFLFLQGDTMFITLRGSHEKLDWPLMLVALTLLVMSVGTSMRVLAQRVLLFYISVFAMMATNVFFASTFVIAVMLSLLLGLASMWLLRRQVSPATDLRRLVYVSSSCAVLFFVFIVYIYPPSLANLRMLQTMFDQVGATVLGFEVIDNPYAYVGYGWIDPRVWFGVTTFTWLLIGLSFAEWLWQASRILKKQKALRVRESLVWLLYAGFAIQVAAAVVADASGVLSQNLQLRIFPGFTVLAVSLLAQGVQRVLSSPRLPKRTQHILFGLFILLVAFAGIASLFKATNEPLLSNKWTFYSPSEKVAIGWFEDNVRNARVWTAVDERLREVYRFHYAHDSTSANSYDAAGVQDRHRYVLFSERERLRGIRMEIAMPSVLGWNRVYDGGDAYFYHRRPRTPYQR